MAEAVMKLMVGLQFGSAGMYILTMDALNKGMRHFVFIVYRNAIAAITLGPFTLVLERKVRPKMTFRIFLEIMALAFLEKSSSSPYAFSPIFQGIVTPGIQYYVQGLVMKTMGPVFVTAFNPLRMIVVTALACIVLSEQLHLGSIIGGVVVAVGLYLVAWGKYQEYKDEMPPSPAKDTSLGEELQLPVTTPRNDTNNDRKAHQLVIIGD